jgi:ribosomal-protein-alanine N-acetyltransferase
MNTNTVSLETPRLNLSTADKRMAKAISEFYLHNSDHLREWEDIKSEDYYTPYFQRRMIKQEQERMAQNTGMDFWIFLKSSGKLIGKVSVFGIIGGNFSLCVIGYKLDVDHVGFGYMTEALGSVETFLFESLNFRRIEINIIPRNQKSLNVVKRLGYELECEVKEYIYINGKWEDHYRYVKVNKKWRNVFA